MNRKDRNKLAEKAMMHHRPARVEIGHVLKDTLNELTKIEVVVDKLRNAETTLEERLYTYKLLNMFEIESGELKNVL